MVNSQSTVINSSNNAKMRWFILVVICVKISVIFCEKARFDNYRVYSIKIENEKQLKVLQELESNPDGFIFTEAPIAVKYSAEIVVPPHKIADINEFLEEFEFESDIKNHDLQR